MQYKIKLSDMEFRAYHGCYELEQQVGNRFMVDLEITTWSDEIPSDQIANVVNYLTVYEIVAEVMGDTKCTIEAVAHNIIEAIKENIPHVEGVKCSVAKLAPPLGGKIGRVSVELEE